MCIVFLNSFVVIIFFLLTGELSLFKKSMNGMYLVGERSLKVNMSDSVCRFFGLCVGSLLFVLQVLW